MATNSSDQRNYLIPIGIFAALALGFYLGHRSNPWEVTSSDKREVLKFNTILGYIEENYVDEVERNELIDRSIESMLAELDPHSRYIPAQDLSEVNERLEGRFEGIGVRFLIHRDTLVVTHVIEDGPSERAGLRPADRIISVDDEEITDGSLTNERVLELLKGKGGTTVRLQIQRDKAILEKTIIRGPVFIESVDAAMMMDPYTGYIRITSFSEPTYQEFMSASKKLLDQGMTKMILDLRDNGGGYLSAATAIVDEFLEEGKLIVYTEGNNREKTMTYSKKNGMLRHIDIVVLINENSASASEIVAGALQDNDRGTIMGRRSFGKGLVQEQHEWEDGSAIRLTIARYYTPTGRSIQRPYGKCIDYHEAFTDRYKNGELYQVDSSIFVDSLKFTTPGGKVVYGGGGIMPDVFIPADTSGYSAYLGLLRYYDVFNHFAFDYLDNERARASGMDYRKFLSDIGPIDEYINQLVTYARAHFELEAVPQQIEHSKQLMWTYLKAHICRNIWKEEGFIFALSEEDNEIKKALKYFQTRKAA